MRVSSDPGPDLKAAWPDFQAARPDFEAAGPDFETARPDFEEAASYPASITIKYYSAASAGNYVKSIGLNGRPGSILREFACELTSS